MIDKNAAEKAMIVYSEKARCDVPDYVAMQAALEAYEAARPKLPTITGLPEMVDGKRIVEWRHDPPEIGDWCYDLETCDFYRAWTDGRGYVAFIAITEADNG